MEDRNADKGEFSLQHIYYYILIISDTTREKYFTEKNFFLKRGLQTFCEYSIIKLQKELSGKYYPKRV